MLKTEIFQLPLILGLGDIKRKNTIITLDTLLIINL